MLFECPAKPKADCDVSSSVRNGVVGGEESKICGLCSFVTESGKNRNIGPSDY